MEKQAVKDTFLKSGKSMDAKKGTEVDRKKPLEGHLKYQKLIMNRAFTQGTGGGQQTHSAALQLNV